MCKLLYVYVSDEYFILSTRSAPPVQFLWVRRKVLTTEAADRCSLHQHSVRGGGARPCRTVPQCHTAVSVELCLLLPSVSTVFPQEQQMSKTLYQSRTSSLINIALYPCQPSGAPSAVSCAAHIRTTSCSDLRTTRIKLRDIDWMFPRTST